MPKSWSMVGITQSAEKFKIRMHHDHGHHDVDLFFDSQEEAEAAINEWKAAPVNRKVIREGQTKDD
jgi:hypothetical protein